MKATDSNRVNMINAVIVLSDLPGSVTATSGISAYATVLGQVKTKMVLINGANIIGGGSTSGVTLDTKGLRKAMELIAMKCANATIGFANSTHNNTLKALVNISASKLAGTQKEDVDDVCEGIQNATAANIGGAITFGALATDPADLGSAIGLYRTASQKPRNAVISRSQAKKDVSRMVGEVVADLFVGQMDKMVDTLKVSNVGYWKSYKQAREIINLGSTTAKVRGSVKDELDVPKSNVRFSIFKTGTATLVTMVITDAKGKFNATNLPVGDFDFKWELDTYITVTETNVHIAAGKELQRRIVLKKV